MNKQNKADKARSSPQLVQLAELLHSTASWDDLTLPDSDRQYLQKIGGFIEANTTLAEPFGDSARADRGITTLFAGPSGTGKTLAAVVLAKHLNLMLYRVNLSRIVSKYIGETEKNLDHLFDTAEKAGAVLLFDEADALFGKRVKVKDSHDRYANIEVSYLLQRMESVQGLTILSTNMKSDIDQTLLRRFRFVIEFPSLMDSKSDKSDTVG